MTKFAMNDRMVLTAIKRAVSPDSAYILDELRREQQRHVAAGGTGSPPTSQQTLRRLRSMEKLGLVEASAYPNGYYGYRWKTTERGHLLLEGDAS